MSSFANDEQAPSVEELMPWDVQTDRETGVFAFVNAKARLKILVLPPEITQAIDASAGDKWTARLVHECPYSTLKPYFLAIADSEIEVIEQVEDNLLGVTRKDQALLDALNKLQAAGLVIESPVNVAAALEAIGLGEAESWIEATFYDIPSERTA